MGEILRHWSPGDIVLVIGALGWLWRVTTQSGAPPDPPRKRIE